MEANNILKKLESYGKIYRKTYLFDRYDKSQISANWWEGLIFCLDHIYYQGRKDIISQVVRDNSIRVLTTALHFPKDTNTAFDTHCESDWTEIKEELEKVIGKGKIGKANDIKMTIDILRLLSTLPDKNIVNHCIDNIEKAQIKVIYNELQKRVISVGPKISSFLLRDIISLFGLDEKVDPEGQLLLQPIDTWVRKVAEKIELIPNTDVDDNQVRQAIVKTCLDNSLSPILINQGAWYVGYHSFDIAINLLDKR